MPIRSTSRHARLLVDAQVGRMSGDGERNGAEDRRLAGIDGRAQARSDGLQVDVKQRSPLFNLGLTLLGI